MNDSRPLSMTGPAILAFAVALALTGPDASAADNDLRISPQAVVGTAGFEPGLAFEWRRLEQPLLILRPEVFVSEDGRIGAGGAILYDVSLILNLPKRQAVTAGPRAVYHNADHYGWEADAMATWSYDLVGGARAWQHTVGVLGAVGVIQDKKHDDHDLGASAGIFYSFKF